jgi:hypothetical protein
VNARLPQELGPTPLQLGEDLRECADRRFRSDDFANSRAGVAKVLREHAHGDRIAGARNPGLVGQGAKRAHENTLPFTNAREVRFHGGRRCPLGEISGDTQDERVLDLGLHEGWGGCR